MSDLLILRAADFNTIQPDYANLLKRVRDSIIEVTQGLGRNPAKVAIRPDQNTFTISMMGFSPEAGCVGFKSYSEFSSSTRIDVSTTLTLLETKTGVPLAFMDCDWITATRTGAVCALMIEHLSNTPKTVLIVGAGRQTRGIIPFLMHAVPTLEEIIVLTSSVVSFEALIGNIENSYEGSCKLSRCINASQAAAQADVVIGATDQHSSNVVSLDMLKPGALAIYVGYGLAADVLHGADKVVTTSHDQMVVTGQDLIDENGSLPEANSELGQVLEGSMPGRTSPKEIIAAYNSGLAVTDIIVGRYIYDLIKKHGDGNLVRDFTPKLNSQPSTRASGIA